MDISKDIIEELIADSQKAFHTVFKMTYPKVYGFSMGFLKNETDAEDVAQLVFIKLWAKRAMLANVHNFDSYLYSITKNTVLNHLAAKKAISVDISEVGDVAARSDSPLELIEANDLKLMIDMIVENMPPHRQTIYRLSRDEGLTNDQIAEKLGIQKKTVENHLNIALKEIREILKKIMILLFSFWV